MTSYVIIRNMCSWSMDGAIETTHDPKLASAVEQLMKPCLCCRILPVGKAQSTLALDRPWENVVHSNPMRVVVVALLFETLYYML